MTRPRGVRLALAVAALCMLLGVAAGTVRSTNGDDIRLTMLGSITGQPAYSAVIDNFQRTHPNIKIEVTYTPTVASTYQLVTTELAAGNAPDLFPVYPGCGTPISICKLAKSGHLAPLVGKAWAKKLDPRVLSMTKYGSTLYMFEPTAVFDGLLTNDTKLKQLGLKIPQTFTQLLAFCHKARAAGHIPLMLTALSSNTLQQLIADIALTTVYAKDKQWLQKLRAGKVTFSGTPGWHQALQEIVDMGNAECFQTGPAGTSGPVGDAMFAQGQGLTYAMVTSHKGAIDAGKPAFAYSQSPFPASRTNPRETVVELHFPFGLGINAHASAANQAAAQAFIDFLARPDQNALMAEIGGGLSNSQLRTGRLPKYLSSFVPLYKQGRYAVNPIETWWNAGVGNALTTYGTGLLTGQNTVDDVLKAMDVAWKLGPD
jgi:raffinose/stachyose/melibiose transport system substrate-binding protein